MCSLALSVHRQNPTNGLTLAALAPSCQAAAPQPCLTKLLQHQGQAQLGGDLQAGERGRGASGWTSMRTPAGSCSPLCCLAQKCLQHRAASLAAALGSHHLNVGIDPLLAPGNIIRWLAPAARGADWPARNVSGSKGRAGILLLRLSRAHSVHAQWRRPSRHVVHAQHRTHLSGQRCITA